MISQKNYYLLSCSQITYLDKVIWRIIYINNKIYQTILPKTIYNYFYCYMVTLALYIHEYSHFIIYYLGKVKIESIEIENIQVINNELNYTGISRVTVNIEDLSKKSTWFKRLSHLSPLILITLSFVIFPLYINLIFHSITFGFTRPSRRDLYFGLCHIYKKY
jgi:hypothetical protein